MDNMKYLQKLTILQFNFSRLKEFFLGKTYNQKILHKNNPYKVSRKVTVSGSNLDFPAGKWSSPAFCLIGENLCPILSHHISLSIKHMRCFIRFSAIQKT